MKTYMVCIPTLPGFVLDELPGILGSCYGLHHSYLTEKGNSSIPLARNNMADTFLKHTRFDSMIWIDSDILFTREDLERIQSGPESAVCATYAKKDDTGDAATWGMGFARIDRSVFETLIEQKAACEVFVPGWNRVMHDFFICGSAINPQDPNGMRIWLNEDTGFWSLVQNAGISTRLETGLDLGHVGRKVYRLPHSTANDGALKVIEPPMTEAERLQWEETCIAMGSLPSPSPTALYKEWELESKKAVDVCACGDFPDSNPLCKIHGVM